MTAGRPAHEIVDEALAAAGGRGADRVVIVEETSQAELRFANNTATTNGLRSGRKVTIVSYASLERGLAAVCASSSGSADSAQLLELARSAEAAAASSPAAPDAVPLLAAGDVPASPSRFPDPAETTSLAVDDLVGRTERGILLTCLWYIWEVDPSTLLLTGLARDGVYLVERGEVVGALNNFRFNESPVDVLARAVGAGCTARALSREWGEWFPRTAMSPLRVEGFNMSSASPAT